ncbi:AraC family transcriptional regulator [Nocardia sp. NBC_01327]|uniref:AraC family transcriptional regulator n=1 Tax=Nocardia sp. NBC_01327 TaxID=2903593 RepID=UPI002E14D133|nr:AraC family transcriptional regulator ligand-binding domain-containing protein [Nocardia sp. NBC_01327]
MTDRMNMLRSSASAAILVELGTEYAMTIGQCLEGSGVTAAILGDPGGEIQARQELRIVQNLVQAIGHVPALGLQAGKRYHLTSHGIWSFAVITSATVRQAWRIGIDYMDIAYSFGRWRFEQHASGGSAIVDYSGVPAELRTFLLERDIAETITVDRDVFGTTVPPTRVELACPPPDYAEEFRSLLGTPPIFDAPVTRITLAREILDLPMPQANPQVAMLAEQQAADIMQRRHAREGIGVRVRSALLVRGVTASQDEIAADLRMSVRTLRRRLDADGTSYRELVAETRQTLAEELLAIGATVEDVAQRLGYADASSFTHAFTRWTGGTPGRFARAHR